MAPSIRSSLWIRHAAAVHLVVFALGCATTGSLERDEQMRKRALAHYNMGIDHLDNGRTPLAMRELREAERLDPTDAWTHVALAEAYRRTAHHDQAIDHLERALELDPARQVARLNLSGVYIQAGRYHDAIREAQPLANDPTFPTPWRALTNLGWAQHRVGQTARARENLQLAVQYHEKYRPALLNLGILEGEGGRRLEALSLFRRVLEQRPGSLAEAEASYRIAEIYIALGQQERAVGYLARAVETKPNGRWGKKSAEYLKLLR